MTKTLLLPKKQSLLLLVVFTMHGIFAQTIRYVNTSLSGGSNNGTNWANAYNDLQPAIAAAQSGDQIWVAKGTYYPSTNNQTISFVMKNNVAIYGGFIGVETTITQRDWKNNMTTLSGDIDHATDPLVVTGSGATLSITGNAGNSYNVINNNNNSLNQTAILDGFTVSGGSNTNNFAPNSVGTGGGMYNSNSSPYLANLTFLGNYAYFYGSGIYNSYSSPSLFNIAFLKNKAGQDGGGIYNAYSSPIVLNCMFSGNYVGSTGGGVCGYASTSSFLNCIFLENKAGFYGGGLYNNSSSINFTNCLFSGNISGGGGGMYNDYSPSNIINCVFSGNSSNGGYGSGIFNFYSFSKLQNSIVWGNSNMIYDNSNRSTVIYSNIQGGYAGTGNINQDPLFVDATNPPGADGIFGTADDGLKLQSKSPCINIGSNAIVPAGDTTDIAGLPRIMVGTVDMGAYESPYGNVLPLTLLNFNGNRQASINLLQWTTANEVGTRTFIVESGIDGNNSTEIGKVAATGGGKYSFIDSNPFATRTYYRLKMMDVDGRFTYSNIIMISMNATSNISVYPNPVIQTTTLNIGNNIALIGTQAQLTDAGGRLVKQINIAHNQEQLDMSTLPAGLYVLKLKEGGTIKIFKQ